MSISAQFPADGPLVHRASSLRINRSLLSNLAFSVLVTLFGSYYVRTLGQTRVHSAPNGWLATLLVAGFLGEGFALPLKLTVVRNRMYLTRALGLRCFLIWVAYVITAGFVIDSIFEVSPPGWSWLRPVIGIVCILKMLIAGGFLCLLWLEGKTRGEGIPPGMEFVVDVFLAGYGFLVYGAVWESQSAADLLRGLKGADSVTYRLFHYSFFFLIFYLSTCIGQLTQEWTERRVLKQRLAGYGSLLVAMVVGIAPLFRGPPVPDRQYINLPNSKGQTALLSAIEYQPLPYLKRLIEAGADLNHRDTNGWTALHYAARAVRPKALDLLLNKGVDLDVQANSGATPLALAVGFSLADNSLVEILLEHHADPNKAYTDGTTPLMLAAENVTCGQNVRMLETLIKHGANANAADTNGWNALMRFCHYHSAAGLPQRKALDLLIGHTSLVTRDSKGHSVVWHATKYNSWSYDDVAARLVEAGAVPDPGEWEGARR